MNDHKHNLIEELPTEELEQWHLGEMAEKINELIRDRNSKVYCPVCDKQ